MTGYAFMPPCVALDMYMQEEVEMIASKEEVVQEVKYETETTNTNIKVDVYDLSSDIPKYGDCPF